MSLILDALRKADSERELGSVPGLNAQPAPRHADAEPASTRSRRGSWAALGVAVVAAVAAAVFVLGGRESPPPARDAATTRAATGPAGPSVREPARAPSATVAPAPVASVPAQTPVAAAPTPLPAAPTPVPSPPAPASAAPAPAAAAAGAASPIVAEPAPVPVPAPRTPPPAPAKASAEPPPAKPDARTAGPVQPVGAAKGGPGAVPAPAAKSTSPTPPATPASDSPIYSREQLPEQVRAELPQLTIGGSIYSMRPSDRSLLINGRLFREGDVLAPDFTLERIDPKSAVFRYKGYRFETRF